MVNGPILTIYNDDLQALPKLYQVTATLTRFSLLVISVCYLKSIC